jgi:UDP-glucuronate decarboxylase
MQKKSTKTLNKDYHKLEALLNDDFSRISKLNIPWKKLKNKKFLITGGTGFIVSYLIKMLFLINEKKKLNITIDCTTRSINKTKILYGKKFTKNFLKIHKISLFNKIDIKGRFNYVIHAASLASPKYFKNNPIDVILPNIVGTINLLKFSEKKKLDKFVFFSSTGVNGFLDDKIRPISEDVYGALDPTLIENSYLESKRMGENLCYAWFSQKNVPIQIVRPAITYGPGVQLNDGRSYADFISSVVNNKDIELFSDGSALRNYCYISDFFSGLMIMLLKGKIGGTYNIANEEEISIKKLANLIVNKFFKKKKLKVIYKSNNNIIRVKYNRTTVSTKKLRSLGWRILTSLEDGFKRTIKTYE